MQFYQIESIYYIALLTAFNGDSIVPIDAKQDIIDPWFDS